MGEFAATEERSQLELDVLVAIKPSAEEDAKMERVAAGLVDHCKDAAAFFGLKVQPKVVGSFEKKTHLKGADLDIFLLFDPRLSLEELKEAGLKVAKSVMDGETRYAEHPYLRGFKEGIRVDIVPAFAVPSPREMKSAVDRTPFHNEFVRDHLREAQRDEVRLLKHFLKGIGAYGSELATRGFSGYLCELLVILYGSFPNVLVEASKWREGLVLAIEGSAPQEAVAAARKHFAEPLVFIDPVDPERNVGSPVSADNFSLFAFASKEYLRSPRPTFFFPRGKAALTPDEIRERAAARGTRVLGVGIRGSDEVEDVWVPQLYKSLRSMEKLLGSYGFNLLRSEVYWGPDTLFLFELQAGRLPAVNKHFGPAASHENARNFLEKWNGRPGQLSKVYIEGGRLMVDVAREYTDAADLLRERAAGVSHGKLVADAFAAGFEVLEIDDLAREPYTRFAADFLQPGLPWEF